MLGLIGGFSAPVLAFAWPKDHFAVFGFYAVLGVAVVAVSRLKVLANPGAVGLWLHVRSGRVVALCSRGPQRLGAAAAIRGLLRAAVHACAVGVASGAVVSRRACRFHRCLDQSVGVLHSVRRAWRCRRCLSATCATASPSASAVLAVVHAGYHQLSRRLGSTSKQFEVAYAALAVVFSATAVPLFSGRIGHFGHLGGAGSGARVGRFTLGLAVGAAGRCRPAGHRSCRVRGAYHYRFRGLGLSRSLRFLG